MKNKFFVILIIFTLVIISYGSVLNSGFTWDDESLVTKNSLVRAPLLSFEIFKQDVLNTGFVYSIYYRPVQILTYALDYRLWGMDSAAFHFTNIILHFLNSVIVYFLTLKITRREAPAFFTSLFFAIHPAFTGAVSYISGRADLLFFLFGMAYMLLYLTFIETKRRSFLWAALASFVISLLCKEAALIFPALLVLLTFFTCKRAKENCYLQIPGFVIAGIYLAAHNLIFGERYFHLGPGEGIKDLGVTYIKIVAESLRVVIFPADLHVRRIFSADGRYVVVAAVTVFTLLMARLKKDRGILLFSGGFFAVSLMPLVFAARYSEVFAEHWIYLACYGVMLAVAVTFSRTFEEAGKAGKRFLVALLFLSVVSYVWTTIQQNRFWAGDRSLSGRVLAFSGKDDPAMFFNAVSYMKEGDAEKSREAMEAYADAMGPDPAAWYLKGRLELALGNADTAETDFRKVLEIDPNSPDGFMGLALSALSKGDSVSGAKSLEQAIKLNPSHHEALLVLTKVYSDSGEFDKAIRTAKAARKIKPFDHDTLVNLGTAYTRKGMLNEAAESYLRATELYPEEPLAYYDMGQVFLSAGKKPEALEWFRKAIIASPGFKPAVDAIEELKREE